MVLSNLDDLGGMLRTVDRAINIGCVYLCVGVNLRVCVLQLYLPRHDQNGSTEFRTGSIRDLLWDFMMFPARWLLDGSALQSQCRRA